MIPVQFPHIIGWDFSGVVDSVGESVTDFKVGDKVYCRPEVTRNGSHAEYILVPEDHLAHMPKTISFSCCVGSNREQYCLASTMS